MTIVYLSSHPHCTLQLLAVAVSSLSLIGSFMTKRPRGQLYVRIWRSSHFLRRVPSLWEQMKCYTIQCGTSTAHWRRSGQTKWLFPQRGKFTTRATWYCICGFIRGHQSIPDLAKSPNRHISGPHRAINRPLTAISPETRLWSRSKLCCFL